MNYTEVMINYFKQMFQEYKEETGYSLCNFYADFYYSSNKQGNYLEDFEGFPGSPKLDCNCIYNINMNFKNKTFSLKRNMAKSYFKTPSSNTLAEILCQLIMKFDKKEITVLCDLSPVGTPLNVDICLQSFYGRQINTVVNLINIPKDCDIVKESIYRVCQQLMKVS